MTLEDPDLVWFGDDEAPPKKGNVLVLNYHHDGESHWCTPEQARNRIEFILDGGKPEEERGSRMEVMRIVPFGKWWKSKACSEAEAVYSKACDEAWAVYSNACSEAWAVYSKARSEALAVYSKARSEALAVYAKACSEAEFVYYKAWSEAEAVYAKAWSEAWAEAYPAEAWVVENVP